MSTTTAGLQKHCGAEGVYYSKTYLSFTANFRYNGDDKTWYVIIRDREADGHRGGRVAMMFTDFVTLGALRETVDRWVEVRADARITTPVQLELRA